MSFVSRISIGLRGQEKRGNTGRSRIGKKMTTIPMVASDQLEGAPRWIIAAKPLGTPIDDNLNGRANICLGSVIGLNIAGVAAGLGAMSLGNLAGVVSSRRRRRRVRAPILAGRPWNNRMFRPQ
jgi:hypothetical protein